MNIKRLESKTIAMPAKPCDTAGFRIRSGVKAGANFGDREFGSMRGGEVGRGPREFG